MMSPVFAFSRPAVWCILGYLLGRAAAKCPLARHAAMRHDRTIKQGMLRRRLLDWKQVLGGSGIKLPCRVGSGGDGRRALRLQRPF
jgi:hypothetical protein